MIKSKKCSVGRILKKCFGRSSTSGTGSKGQNSHDGVRSSLGVEEAEFCLKNKMESICLRKLTKSEIISRCASSHTVLFTN
jgi:hypothetical protein